MAAQGVKRRHHLGRQAAVHPTVVAHHRVNDRQGVRPVFNSLLYQQGLACLRQITGINAVKFKAKAAVMGQCGRAVTGACKPSRRAQPAGVGGQHRRGHRDGLHAHCGKDRNNYRQPRPAETGQVMDAKNGFGGRGHGKNPHFLGNCTAPPCAGKIVTQTARQKKTERGESRAKAPKAPEKQPEPSRNTRLRAQNAKFCRPGCRAGNRTY